MDLREGRTPRKLSQFGFGRVSHARRLLRAGVSSMAVLLLLTGCFSRAVNKPNSDLGLILEEEEPSLTFVGGVTSPVGMKYVKVESVALVRGLDGTGSDPPPSALRRLLMSEMQTRGVKSPNRLLAHPSTAMVHVACYLPPGVQKGDSVDVEVRIAPRSETKSLRGGWLEETRLKEMAVLGGRVRDGHLRAVAQGPIIIDASLAGDDDPVSLTRGRVPGGARSRMSRSLGLVIRGDQRSARLSARIGTVINTRFHTFDEHGIKRGVANPTKDSFIELKIHPRYRSNIARYVHIIRCIPVNESPVGQVTRLAELERELLVPETASRAAMKLEALGQQGANTLANGLQSDDLQVRFYAAEALAYLDDNRAITQLADAARNEPAFRWHALTALSVMDDLQVFDELEKLLDVESAETRYGAFQALKARGPNAPVVKGEIMRGGFAYHVIDTNGEPMIHLSRSGRPEIVVFGKDERFVAPFMAFAGKEFIVNGRNGDTVRVTRFLPGQEDVCEECSTRVDDVIRAIDKLGGGYNHVIQLLREARAKQDLPCRIVLDARPRAGRKYSEENEVGDSGSVAAADSPLPNLFFARSGSTDDDDESDENTGFDPVASGPDDQKAQSGGGFFDTMKGWLPL